jgi:hypothetical protein
VPTGAVHRPVGGFPTSMRYHIDYLETLQTARTSCADVLTCFCKQSPRPNSTTPSCCFRSCPLVFLQPPTVFYRLHMYTNTFGSRGPNIIRMLQVGLAMDRTHTKHTSICHVLYSRHRPHQPLWVD